MLILYTNDIIFLVTVELFWIVLLVLLLSYDLHISAVLYHLIHRDIRVSLTCVILFLVSYLAFVCEVNPHTSAFYKEAPSLVCAGLTLASIFVPGGLIMITF